MKLSEAMMLGSVTCKLEAGNINSCAYGCSLNALGVPQVADGLWEGEERYKRAVAIWPWIEHPDFIGHMNHLGVSVYRKFDLDVCTGSMTLEQLADYVRSIEPSCGECNRFECSCVSEAVSEAKEVPCVTV